MKGVFLDLGTVDRNDLELTALQETLPEWRMYRDAVPKNLLDRILDAQIVVTNKIPLDELILRKTTQLQLICVAATGTNNVDLNAATEHGITVCNARGYATTSVVEHVFGLILALTRRLPQYQQAIDHGAWQKSSRFSLLDFAIRELSGRTLGIIGGGELGQAVGKVAAAFGMNTVLAERRGAQLRSGRVAFETVLQRSDVISIHCPLTPDTTGLIGAEELAQLKTDAILIHTARGGIVDETALLTALRTGRIGGAGVDVLSEEPPKHGNPLLDVSLPNLIVTPHVAWASREARQRLIQEIVENIRGFANGQPRNMVN